MGAMPVVPEKRASLKEETEDPIGVTQPSPVITTRFTSKRTPCTYELAVVAEDAEPEPALAATSWSTPRTTSPTVLSRTKCLVRDGDIEGLFNPQTRC